jgi:hypothetical protein
MIEDLEYFLYRLLIDPLLRSARDHVIERIRKDATLIDIASGTGTLVFEAASKCSGVTGVDLSESMIRNGNKKRDRLGLGHVNFILADAGELSMFKNKQFDYAVLSMAVHQFPEAARTSILAEAARVASSLFIIDYHYPVAANTSGLAVKTIEWLAGREHNRNFRNYCRNGGLNPLIKALNLHVEHEARLKGRTLTVLCAHD